MEGIFVITPIMIKNNKYLLLLVAAYILMFGIAAKSQPLTFQKTYGSSVNEIGSFVQPTLDGGYIMCGAKGVPGTIGYYDYYLVKVDKYGDVAWTKTIGDSLNDEQALCVRQLQDGSYIVYGNHSASSSSTAWLVKTDEYGNVTWNMEQQGSFSSRYGYSLVIAPDGGYQTASLDNGPGTNDYFQLQKTEYTGKPQWGPKNIVQGIGNSSSLAVTKDNNYVAVGTTNVFFDASTKNNIMAISLMKMNISGTVLWSKTYMVNSGTLSYNYLQGFGVTASSDGGYVICGSTNIKANGGTDIFLLKTNGSGDSLWSKNYGGYANDVALSIKEIPAGGFVLTGNTKSYGSGSTDIFILRTTANGDSLWMRTYGGAGLELAGNIEVTDDGGFAVIGTTNSFGNGQNDFLLIRTDSKGGIPDATISYTAGSSSNKFNQYEITMCTGSTITLSANPGYTYKWSNGATTQSINIAQAGKYAVAVTDNFNNINTSVEIKVVVDYPISSASLTASGPLNFCVGNTVTLIADSISGYTYQWQVNNADIFGATARKYTAAEDGVYNAIVSNTCNRVKTPVSEVIVSALPQTPTITMMGNMLISSSSNNNQWYRDGKIIPGEISAYYTPVQSGNYQLVVSNESNCTSSSEPYYFNTVGFEENTSNLSYTLFPNPATSLIYVDYDLGSTVYGYFIIYSADGKEIYREKLENEKGLLQINSEHLANGFYFSGIETQNVVIGRKTLVILHR